MVAVDGPRRVLVVDDDVMLVRMLQAALTVQGFKVSIASSGLDALRHVEQSTPNLVILDVRMRDVSGIETCRRIRQISKVPIIMLTGASDEQHENAGFVAGADDYVTKPFSLAELVLRIEAILHRVEGKLSTPI